jgi:hypothetical protein
VRYVTTINIAMSMTDMDFFFVNIYIFLSLVMKLGTFVSNQS